jgi:hypothetical protein
MADEESTAPQDLKIVNPRRELMDQIVANDLENKIKEIEQGGGKREDVVHEEKAAPEEEKPAEEAKAEETHEEAPAEEAAAPAAEAAQEEKPAEKTVKIKVDGKEQEVPESRVIELGIKTLQKETAADSRLLEADRLLKEFKQHKESLAGLPKGADKPEVVPVDAKALAHAIQYGSEDEAAEALKKLTGTQNGLTPEEAVRLVDERTAFRSAMDWYERECKDIASDPNLDRLFRFKDREKRQAGDSRPYLQVWNEIATEIRDWRGGIAPKPKDELADKRTRKAEAPAQPVAASARKPAPKEEKEPTTSEVIADIAASRGRSRQLPPGMRRAN